jgi:hypothetical protein
MHIVFMLFTQNDRLSLQDQESKAKRSYHRLPKSNIDGQVNETSMDNCQ